MATASRPVLFLAAGASVLFAIALLLLLEFAAGFIADPVHPQEIEGDSVSRTVTWLELNPAPLVRDVDLLWRNEPNARKTQPVNPKAYGRDDHWTIENNSDGFRGSERSDAGAGKKVFRILCVGDSITFGFSVDQPDTYARQLLALLKQRYPDREFEIINAGVPGWSYLQGLRFLDVRGMALEPDLIVIGHGTNDQLFPSKVADEERFLRLASPTEYLLQRIAVLAVETNIYRAVSKNLPARSDDQPSPGCRQQIVKFGGCSRMSLDHIASAIHEISELAAGHGVDLLVANTDFVQTPAIQGIKRGVDADKLPFVDLVEEFNRRRADDENARADRVGLARASEVSPQAAPAEKKVVLRVLVPDASLSYRVAGLGYFHPEWTFADSLYDDGTHGDERALDGVFSTTVTLPPQYAALEYKYHQAETAEFAALPPFASALGDRVLQAPGNRIGPVDVFGESLFMVERAHPNRDGHQLIAQLVADKIAEMPAFRQFVQGEPSAAGQPKAATGGQPRAAGSE